ncbi:MAG TPA: TolC family protein [Vicinamibacteria bacterium]|nr:TolC family protein [Vicinamibacteria bacterium]
MASAGLLCLLLAAVETPLTLPEAIAKAERANPELLAARERAVAQDLRGEAAGRARWPRLSLRSGLSRTDQPSWVFAQTLDAGEFTQENFAIERLNAPASLSHLTTTLALEAPLDVFGKLGDQAEGQRSLGRTAGAIADEARLEIRARVVEAYHRAALARRAAEVTERALAGARAREGDVEARVTEGAALTADLLRARARRRQREAVLAERRGDAAVAGAALARLLGAAPGEAYAPADEASAPAALAKDEAALAAEALADRPAVRAAQERLAALQRSARGEDRAPLPDLVAWGQLQDDRNSFSNGGQSYAVGLQLRWNALDAGRGRRQAAAAAEVRAAEQDARAAADQVRLEVATAYRRALTARERHAAAAGGAAEGREALRVVQERHRAGRATLTDELETEAASLEAELQEVAAAAEVAIADAALARATGNSHGDGETQGN